MARRQRRRHQAEGVGELGGERLGPLGHPPADDPGGDQRHGDRPGCGHEQLAEEQQEHGGRLADLFHTLSDVIRARDEVKREVQILTAEGRMSAYVLAGLVPVLFLMMRMVNPDYLVPLYSGTGLFVLIGCGLLVVTGLFVILRMVKIDV